MICWGFLVVFTCEAAAAPPPVVVCPGVQPWTKSYQRQLADELAQLPRNGAIWRSTREHIHLRDRARKCRGK